MPVNYRIAEEMGTDWCPEIPSSVVGWQEHFEASPQWSGWIRKTFIGGNSDEAEGRLVNVEHSHLKYATIGVLLTSAENKKQGRRIVGTAQMPKPRAGWGGALSMWQLRQFFKGHVPQCLITLDANYMMECSPGTLCALIEHELYHLGQARDEFGMAKFNKDGKPIFAMRAHDVQEFVGVGRRYGAHHSSGGTAALVAACREAPLFDDVDILNICCGSCF